MYYITQFWLIFFPSWPRAINIVGTSQGPPTKTEMVCWRWQGQGQCQILFSWPCFFFFFSLLILFLMFPWAKYTIYLPNSKYLGEWSGGMRELKIINILICQLQFFQTLWELNFTFLWHCLWSPKTWNLIEITLCGTISNYCLKKIKFSWVGFRKDLL